MITRFIEIIVINPKDSKILKVPNNPVPNNPFYYIKIPLKTQENEFD